MKKALFFLCLLTISFLNSEISEICMDEVFKNGLTRFYISALVLCDKICLTTPDKLPKIEKDAKYFVEIRQTAFNGLRYINVFTSYSFDYENYDEIKKIISEKHEEDLRAMIWYHN